MTAPHETVTEWSLVLDGKLGMRLGDHHEMDGLTEREARRRMETWNALHGHVRTTLRHRERRTYLGEWEVAQ